MSRIVKSSGVNFSEQILARVGEKNFLGLWSWPNVQFIKNGKPPKEVADLLVVCGDIVIIFSDKYSKYQENNDQNANWSRWYNRAVQKSIDQIIKAIRYLNQPDNLYLDAGGATRLPIDVPKIKDARIFGIAITHGSEPAAGIHFGGEVASLLLNPGLKGKNEHTIPFHIGDVNPDGQFIHVLDSHSANILFAEIDTITDLCDYLGKKERFFRSGSLLMAGGEEDLVAYYMQHLNRRGEHDFVKSDGSDWRQDESFAIGAGLWNEYRIHPQRLAKIAADKRSAYWDNFIKLFADSILSDTAIHYNAKVEISESEKALRYMALERRLQRRVYGEAIHDAIERTEKNQRRARLFIPRSADEQNETAYVFLQIPFFSNLYSYQEYRQNRMVYLYAYALNVLVENRFLKRVVAIGVENVRHVNGEGSSEDLFVFEPDGIDDGLIAKAHEIKSDLGIMNYQKMEFQSDHGNEFPAVSSAETQFNRAINSANRHQRRKMRKIEERRRR